MKILLILDDAPYGNERCDNALRLAHAVRKRDTGAEVTVFLMADEEYSYVSSTLMKQVFMLGGRVAGLIPELVEKRMRAKIETQT